MLAHVVFLYVSVGVAQRFQVLISQISVMLTGMTHTHTHTHTHKE